MTAREKKPSEAKSAPVEQKNYYENQLALVRSLAAILHESGLGSVRIKRNNTEIEVCARSDARTVIEATAKTESAPTAAAASTGNPPPEKEKGEAVTAPMVGTAYLAPAPDVEPFVKIGQKIEKNQSLLIIEAMKTMNHIHAPRAGVILDICVGNAEPVAYGDRLVVIG